MKKQIYIAVVTVLIGLFVYTMILNTMLISERDALKEEVQLLEDRIETYQTFVDSVDSILIKE